MSSNNDMIKRPSDASLGSSLQNWNADHGKQKEGGNSYKYDSLTTFQFWGYGVGHFINDLSAACWFNYLLYYLTDVIKIDFGSYSILSGQVADAIATPMVGYLSDRTNTRIGKRMPWYIGGYVLIVLTFLPMWNGCLFCDWFGNSTGMEIFYYTLFPALFNFGWASLQISHMSLVPSLSCGRTRRDQLNSLRNTFSFIAILTIYVLALVLFYTMDDAFREFEYLSFIAMGLGTASTIFFFVQIDEPVLTKECKRIAKNLQKILKDRKKAMLNGQSGLRPQKESQKVNQVSDISSPSNLVASELSHPESDPDLDNFQYEDKNNQISKESVNKNSLADEVVHWTQWFKEFQFYRFGLVYMGVRLYCNISSTMITFYLADVLKFQDQDQKEDSDSDTDDIKPPIQLALIPLSLYLFSVIASTALNKIYAKLGKPWTMTIGTVLCVATQVGLAFLTEDTKNFMYGIAPVIGVAQAISLNTGITLISDVIGLRGSSGAFVFGVYSFLDKISAGIVIFAFTEVQPFKNKDIEYIRWVTVIVPAVSCVFAWFLVILPCGKEEEDDDQYVSEIDKASLMGKKLKKSLADELAT